MGVGRVIVTKRAATSWLTEEVHQIAAWTRIGADLVSAPDGGAGA